MKLKYTSRLEITPRGGHSYFIDDNNELLTGVSSILNVRAKDFLKFWASKESVKFLGWFDKWIDGKPINKEKEQELKGLLVEKFEQIKKMSPEDFYDFLEKAKNAHAQKSDKAKDSGKIAHDAIETYIKTGEIKVLEDNEAQNAFNSFLKWGKQYQIKWVGSEIAVASKKYSYGGTLDALAEINGIYYLVDFKTNGQFSDDAFLQTAAYYQALDEMLDDNEQRPAQRLILRIPKDGDDCEECVVPTPLEFDIETFNRMREIYKWNLNIEKNIKIKTKESPFGKIMANPIKK